jgi:hypothetical protein
LKSNSIVGKTYTNNSNIGNIFGSQVKEYIIGDGVTSIGDYAFNGCSSLKTVTIPNSVTSIGDRAFSSCSSLTPVTIPNSVTSIGDYAFSSCRSLTSATIGESVISIGDYAFSGCSSLTSVTIPNSVTSIGKYAFSSCSSLTSLVYNAHCFAYMPTSYAGTYTIPEGIKQIAGGAFSGCSKLTSVTIPNSVMSIGDEAFYGCTSLTSITIPDSVTTIGDEAFGNCSSITSVTIGNSVTNMGWGAFYGCSALKSVVWNAKNCADFSKVSGVPFYDSRSQITSFTLGKDVEYIPEYLCYEMKELTSMTIPDRVTSIGSSTFSGCSSLTSVSIGKSVTSIETWAFGNCSSLAEIAIPNAVTDIGNSAFQGCLRLGKVTLGSSINNIAANAFAECTRLYDVYCYATYPPFVDDSAFANYNVYLYVPCESQRDYTLDIVWGKFKFIECIDSEDVTTDGVVVTPSTNDVTIIWPTEIGADTYTIVIKEGDEVFCTLTFNADGQLLNIAFAPSRDGNHPAQYAEQAGNGYRFTVTGLEAGTHYAYNIDVKDAADKTIKSHAGEFTTESMTAVENTHSQSPISDCQKIIRNGQLLILRDGVEYTIMGQEL